MTRTAPPRPRSKGKRPGRVKPGPRGTEYRRVFPVGHSLAVTLPPACLRLLGVRLGGTVQVVPLPSGKVLIAPMGVRVGAARELVSASKEVALLRRRLTRMSRRLAARPLRVLNEGVALGWMQANTGRFLDLDVLLNLLRRLLAGVEAPSAQHDAGPDPSPAAASSEARTPTA